ncbi:putative O-methyltransferase [Xylariaceae sp. FL0804]|nr:putative O-methyltransferase [Xylariaceae sp. FL0804]
MTTSQSRIAELAGQIATHTQRIDEFIAERGLPQPSFLPASPAELGLPAELESSRNNVLEATQELNDLLAGPRQLLFGHTHNRLLYLKLITTFGIAGRVPVDGEIAYADLAADVGLDGDALARVLRLAIANRVFREPRAGFVAHSAASRQMADDHRMLDWAAANVDDMWPAAGKTVEALAKWPRASEPHQTGFALANGTDSSFFAELAKDPERARRFGGAMSFFTTGEAYSLRHLTDNYPWESLGKGTVVDLGGSHGDAAFAISRKYPDLNIIVQELPGVVDNSKKQEGLNVKFMAHDFFEKQPVEGADVYLFRWILHNWPDQYALKILRALIPALRKGSRVLVMDFIMPPPGVLPNGVERKLRAMDVTMLEIANANERSLDKWKDLFTQADPRFVVKGVREPQGSNLAIFEIMWEG